MMGHTIRIGVEGDMLVAEYSENGAFSPVHSAAYERPDHHYWRVEQRAPTTTFSTSADGVDFTPLMAIEFPFEIGFVRPVLSASRVTQDFAALFSADGLVYEPFIAAGNFVELERAQFAFNLNGIANAGECLVRFDNVNL